MSTEFVIEDNVYSVLLEFFDGDITNIDKKILSGLKKGRYKKKDIEPIDNDVYKTLQKILKMEDKFPEKYADMEWIYPEKIEELDEVEEVEEEDEGEADDVTEGWANMKADYSEWAIEEAPYKAVIPQRKAFIDWVNNVFYKEILDSYKDRPGELEKIKIYQYFVKKYLSIEAPLRGLLM